MVGYSAEVALEIHPGASSEDKDDQYERVRNGLAEYEDEIDPPVSVTLTRRGPLRIAEHQVEASLAGCREAMVDVLGVASDHPRVRWFYRQSEGPYALLIEVRPEPQP